MRICEICGGELKIKLAQRGESIGKYFWGCSKYPECKFTKNTLLSQIAENRYWSHITHNSMKLKYPDDIISDAARHYAIERTIDYNSPRSKVNLDSLDMNLGFNSLIDFYFWVACQVRVVDHSVHNYFPVGSPYYFTFTDMVKEINKIFNDAIEKIFIEQNELINKSVKYWLDLFEAERKAREERLRISAEREHQRHQDAIKRKAEKATQKIFNAIRRKDINAILALRRMGADLNAKNENGLTTLDYAKTINDDRVIAALTNEIRDEETK